MSQQRHCAVFKAQDGQWYLELGNFEHAHEREDCTVYGPFSCCRSAEDELDHHSNPGSMWTDDSGQRPVPEKVTRPTRRAVSRINPYLYRM